MEDTFLLNNLNDCPPDPFNSWFNIISWPLDVYIVLCQANWSCCFGVILHSLDTSIWGRGWQTSCQSFSLFTLCSQWLYSLNEIYSSCIMRPGLNWTHHPFPRYHLLPPLSSLGENHYINLSSQILKMSCKPWFHRQYNGFVNDAVVCLFFSGSFLVYRASWVNLMFHKFFPFIPYQVMHMGVFTAKITFTELISGKNDIYNCLCHE